MTRSEQVLSIASEISTPNAEYYTEYGVRSLEYAHSTAQGEGGTGKPGLDHVVRWPRSAGPTSL